MRLSFTSIITSISAFFKRYHFIIFIVLVTGGASVAVLLINNTVALSDQANDYKSQQNNTSFDEDTINRLRALKDSSQETERLPVTGRVSPF